MGEPPTATSSFGNVALSRWGGTLVGTQAAPRPLPKHQTPNDVAQSPLSRQRHCCHYGVRGTITSLLIVRREKGQPRLYFAFVNDNGV